MEAPRELQKSLHHLTNSVVWLAFRLVAGIFLVETVYVILLVLSLQSVVAQFHTQVVIVLWVVDTIKFFVLAAVALSVVIPWGTTAYYLSDDQLIKYTGLTRRDERAYDLNQLKTVEVHQGFLGRWFNYGDIHLVFASAGYMEKIGIQGIYNPKKYEQVARSYLANKAASVI